MNNLIKKINNKNAKIAVIGLGYVGLPLCLKLLNQKYTVYGIDIDKFRIKNINNSKIYISGIEPNSFKKYLDNKKFIVNDKFDIIEQSDIIIICVPTPVNKNKTPDISPIKKSISCISPFLKKNKLIILESSTYPGTTKEFIVNKFQKKFHVGKNLFVGYSPEREDPGNKFYNLSNTTKLVSGFSKTCTKLVNHFYKKIVKKTYITNSIEVAEFSKLYENAYRAINIAFVNEAKMLAKKLNLNINEIIDAASTKPFGFQKFNPGPGVGGHCIPIDPYYLSWMAKKKSINLDFLDLAGKINDTMINWIFRLIETYRKKNKIKKAKILVIGATYKKNVNDLRESPILKLIPLLKKDYIFSFHDNYIQNLSSKKFQKKFKSVKLTKKNLVKNDIVFIMTDHSYLDKKKKLIGKYSKIIFDSRNFFKEKNKKIIYV